MSSNPNRRGKNPTTAFGILFIVIGAVALTRQILEWTIDFVVQFLFNNEITSEKVAVITIGIGVFIVFLGFRKNEQKG